MIFLREKRILFFKTLPFFQKSIFLKTDAYFSRYFYIESNETRFFFFQIESFGSFAVSSNPFEINGFFEAGITSSFLKILHKKILNCTL